MWPEDSWGRGPILSEGHILSSPPKRLFAGRSSRKIPLLLAIPLLRKFIRAGEFR